jgi:hypothetical protein
MVGIGTLGLGGKKPEGFQFQIQLVKYNITIMKDFSYKNYNE